MKSNNGNTTKKLDIAAEGTGTVPVRLNLGLVNQALNDLLSKADRVERFPTEAVGKGSVRQGQPLPSSLRQALALRAGQQQGVKKEQCLQTGAGSQMSKSGERFERLAARLLTQLEKWWVRGIPSQHARSIQRIYGILNVMLTLTGRPAGPPEPENKAKRPNRNHRPLQSSKNRKFRKSEA